MKNRIIITLPLLAVGCFIVYKIDYSVIWRYCSWSNQTLAMIALWTFSVYLKQRGRNFRITAIPAAFMTAVTITYFIVAPECLGFLWDRIGLSTALFYAIGDLSNVPEGTSYFIDGYTVTITGYGTITAVGGQVSKLDEEKP